MRLAVIHSRTLLGIEAKPITVETHISPGLPGFSIVGLAESSVKQCKERVRSAIINSELEFPAKKIIVNLAPADLPKQGSIYDLAIALSILAASNQIPKESLKNFEFYGELSLTGEVKNIKSSLLIAISALSDIKSIIFPYVLCNNFFPKKSKILLAESLKQIYDYFVNSIELPVYKYNNLNTKSKVDKKLDLSDIYGQTQAKQALTIAAAGNHNLLMTGAPGAGKTMLASRITSIMPSISYEKLLEIAAIKSIKSPFAEQIDNISRPFREPHHSISHIALVGGGGDPKPGEISLAHNGILFLDEFPEFNKKAIEALREPLESREISISRAKNTVCFPANFQLIAAMNPCPCGYFGVKGKNCICSISDVKRYLAKISGPILDRIDLKVNVSTIPVSELLSENIEKNNITSEYVKLQVEKAFNLQLDRQKKSNSHLNTEEIKKYCKLDSKSKDILSMAVDKYNFSPRSCNKIIKVARTIADLNLKNNIDFDDITEAISFGSFTDMNI